MEKYGFIFDMDGVIVDSNPYHKISLRQFCEKYGYTLSDADMVAKIFGRTNREWIANVFGELPAEQIYALTEEKEAMYRTLHEKDMVPLPGLKDFLLTLKRGGYPTAIGTSAPLSNVNFVLEKTGLREFFPVILKDTDITIGKPDPEIYLKAAQRIGLPANQCIVFEDSLSGIAAGRASGAKVVGVTTTHTPEELADTDYVISDFSELNPESLIKILFES
jgi:beta-phosphoglucomutase